MLEGLFTPAIGLIFFQTLIIVGVGWVLKRYAWRPLLTFLQEKEIEAQRTKQALEEHKAKIQALQKESESIVNSALEHQEEILENAKMTKAAMLAEGREEWETQRFQLMNQCQKELKRQENKMRQQIQKEASLLVVQVLHKVLPSLLTQPAAQQQLIHHLIQEAMKHAVTSKQQEVVL